MSDEGGVADLAGLLRTSDSIAANYSRSSIQTGDLVCSIGPSFGKVMTVLEELDGANLTQGTARVAVSNGNSGRYYFWALRSPIAFQQWESSVGGATFRALNLGPLAETRLPHPPLPEQTQIAKFLDYETAKIDALIEKQQQLIGLLKEKRQAVISHAVTKGLNLDAPMRDSGVEWLCEVPAHWKVAALKHLVRSKSGAIKTGPFGSQLTAADMEGSEYKVYNQRSVIDSDFESGDVFVSESKFRSLASFEVMPGDLLVTTRGTIGHAAILPEGSGRGILHPCLLRVQTDPRKLDTEFLRWLVQESDFIKTQLSYLSNSTTIDVIYSNTMASAIIPAPPTDEQLKIVAFLKEETRRLDTLIERAQSGTGLLQERRTALISAAVTGKIDVRAWKTPKSETEAEVA
jgi:type I restriction enzyme S subunit